LSRTTFEVAFDAGIKEIEAADDAKGVNPRTSGSQ
jgi:hypothetical protein